MFDLNAKNMGRIFLGKYQQNKISFLENSYYKFKVESNRISHGEDYFAYLKNKKRSSFRFFQSTKRAFAQKRRGKEVFARYVYKIKIKIIHPQIRIRIPKEGEGKEGFVSRSRHNLQTQNKARDWFVTL